MFLDPEDNPRSLRPHGRSGLKYQVELMGDLVQKVSAHTGGVD